MFIQTSHGKQMIIIAIITLFYIDLILVRRWGRREWVPMLAATGRYKTRSEFIDNPLIMFNHFLCVTVTIKFSID